MSIRKQYGWPVAGSVNLTKLFTEGINLLSLSVKVEGGYADDVQQAVYIDYLNAPTTQDEALVANTITNHDPVSHKDTLLDNADDTIRQMFRGLGKLTPRDAAFTIMARYWKFGKTGQVDLAINSEADALAYITSTAEWVSVPAAVRPFIGDMMTTMVMANFVSLRLQADKITDD